jgi:acetamidase/formamidase
MTTPGSRLVKPLLTALPVLALVACQGAGGTATEQARRQVHEFNPTVFHNEFSATTPPVLRVEPGDGIRTTTLDAAGSDERGVTRGKAGNPQTGPFFLVGATPGTTLAVHITRLRLNRDWAIGTNTLSNLAMTAGLAARMTSQGQLVRWRLDRSRGLAMRESGGPGLSEYEVPLKPMLGCIAVAPPIAEPAHTGNFGPWGGNLDFNEIVEGTTVFLPVNVAGGLLYFGDGHAAQGDGELSGSGLETSMDVEVRVDVTPGSIPAPRLESSTHVMAMGLSSSLEDAVRNATTNMIEWLMARYELTLSEVAQIVGTAAEYRMSVLVGKNTGWSSSCTTIDCAG